MSRTGPTRKSVLNSGGKEKLNPQKFDWYLEEIFFLTLTQMHLYYSVPGLR